MSQKSDTDVSEKQGLERDDAIRGKGVSANRFTTDGPWALTCWHCECHGFR
jgi:hypothetical protein